MSFVTRSNRRYIPRRGRIGGPSRVAFQPRCCLLTSASRFCVSEQSSLRAYPERVHARSPAPLGVGKSPAARRAERLGCPSVAPNSAVVRRIGREFLKTSRRRHTDTTQTVIEQRYANGRSHRSRTALLHLHRWQRLICIRKRPCSQIAFRRRWTAFVNSSVPIGRRQSTDSRQPPTSLHLQHTPPPFVIIIIIYLVVVGFWG